jgi:hypothetical protein
VVSSGVLSELEAGLAGGVGEGLDPAVVLEPAPVEGDGGDALGLGGLGDLGLPTAAAAAALPVVPSTEMSLSRVDAAARVVPVRSSMTWAYIWLSER